MTMILSGCAYSLNPPAIEIICRTVVGALSGYGPGLPTSPVMNTLRLLICLTTTVTFGSSTYFFDSSTMRSRSCAGVNPAACTSLMSGSEIFPSGRTLTSVLSSLSLQNTTDKTSSAPMVYSGGMVTPGAAATAGGVVVAGAAAFPRCAAPGAVRAGCACAAHGSAAPTIAAAVKPAASELAILFERNLAVMFSEKVQETFVIPRVHVEDARHDLVVPA